MRLLLTVIVASFLLLAVGTPGLADEIVLKSGETLVGQPTIEGQTLRVALPSGEVRSFPLSALERIRHDAGVVPPSVPPSRGMTADGVLPAAPPMPAMPPTGGVVERQGLVAPAPCEVPCPPAPCEDPCPPNPCEDPCKWDGPWSFSLGLAWTQAGGNSDSLSFKLDFELLYDRGPWRWKTGGFYAYNENDGVVATNRTFAETQVDRKFAKRWYAFGKGSYDHDEPALLDYRVIGTLGVGAMVIEECDMELTFEVGGGVTWEKRSNLPETVDPSAYVGIDWWKEFSNSGKIVIDYDFLPNLNDFDLSIMRFDARYELPLSACLNLRLGVRLDYQIEPVDPTVEKLDWIVSAGVAVNF